MKYTNKKIRQKVTNQIYNILLKDYTDSDIKQVWEIRNTIANMVYYRGKDMYVVNVNGLWKPVSERFINSIVGEFLNLMELTNRYDWERLKEKYEKYGFKGLKYNGLDGLINGYLREKYGMYELEDVEGYEEWVEIFKSYYFQQYLDVRADGDISSINDNTLKCAFWNNSPKSLESASTKDIIDKIEKQHDSDEIYDYLEAIVLTLYLKEYRNEEFKDLLSDNKLSSFYQEVNNKWYLDNWYKQITTQ